MWNDFDLWFKKYSEGKGNYYAKNYHVHSRNRQFDKFDLKRKAIVTLNRLRSGHTTLKTHLKRIGIIDNNNCSCGHEENIEHILWQCPKYQSNRDKMIKFLTKKLGNRPLSLELLLSSKNKSVIAHVTKFFDSIDIKI